MIPATLFLLILFATCMQEANCCTAWFSRKGRAGAGTGSGVGAAAEGESFDPRDATRERATVSDRVENRAGWTPLHLAAYEGNDDTIRRLIAEGAKVNADSNDGCTPLFVAIKYDRSAAFLALMEAKADWNIKNYYGESAYSILYLAPHYEIWQQLERGYHWPVELLPELHQAVMEGSLARLVAQLQSNPSSVNDKDHLSVTALMLAIVFGYTNMVRSLLEAGTSLMEHNNEGWTALHCAAAFNNTTIAQLLIDAHIKAHAPIDVIAAQPVEGTTPLMVAAFLGHVEIVKALLAAGADIFCRDAHGQTALSIATDKNHAAVIAALTAGD